MLTRDQAIEAAFYSGANLLSFTDERMHNLDWMSPCVPEERMSLKRFAAGYVLDLMRTHPTLVDADLVTIVTAKLRATALANEPSEAAHYSWRVFVAVLRSCAALMDAERAAMTENLIGAAGPPPAAASFADPEDRIDWMGPDPLERISGADRPPAPEPRAARRTGK